MKMTCCTLQRNTKKKVVDCNILNCIQYTYSSFVYTVYILLDALSELSEQDAVISNVCETVDVMTAVDMIDEDDVLPNTCQYSTPPSVRAPHSKRPSNVMQPKSIVSILHQVCEAVMYNGFDLC